MSTERNKPLSEIYISAFLIVLLAGIPTVEIIIRKLFGIGLKGGYDYTRHIVLWLTLLGASVNSFTDRHMKIEFCTKFLSDRGKKLAENLSLFIVVLVSGAFSVVSTVFLMMGFTSEDKVGILSQRLVTLILPVGFLLVIIREMQRKALSKGRIIALCAGIAAALWVSVSPLVNLICDIAGDVPSCFWTLSDYSVSSIAALKLPLLLLFIASGVLGAPRDHSLGNGRG